MTLELRDIFFRYSRTPATPILREISLTLAKGDFTILLGANGSGKSTLLKIAAGFLSPTSGEILLDQKNLADYAARARAQKIAVVSPSSPPALDFTAREMIALGRNPYRSPFAALTDEDTSAIENALRLTETTEFAARAVNQLSDGERARVTLATALAQTPEFLLLDEPTAALDPAQTLRVLTRLRELADSGVGIIAAIHDLSVAAAFAKEVALLKDGKIFANGAVDRIFTTENLAAIYGDEAKFWAKFI